jgi:hypothetical protein
MRILWRLGMYLTLMGIVLATAIWAHSPLEEPWYLQLIRHHPLEEPWYTQLIRDHPLWFVVATIAVGFFPWLVAFIAKSLRRILICAGVVVGILILIPLAVKVDAYLLRYRSERLLADVKSLEVRRTTAEEARRVLQKWEEDGLYHEISGDNWTFGTVQADPITLRVFRDSHNEFLWGGIWWAEWASRFMGWRPVEVAVQIDVRKGVVWDKSLRVTVQTPTEKGRDHLLHGEVTTSSWRFYEGTSAGPTGQILQTLVHPDYLVVAQTRTRRNGPASYAGISEISALLKPNADPEVVRHLENFDLSCITRWFSCRSAAELMPTAWTQYQEDQPRVLAALKQLRCTPEKLEAQARDAQAAAVVEVTSSGTESDDNHDHAAAEFRLVESLRQDKRWEPREKDKIWVAPWMLADNPASTSLALPPGQRFILLFSVDHPPIWLAPRLWPYPCGVIPWSEANLALVRHAVADDARVDDPEGVE